MTGRDVWGLISPMISPMANDAMNNMIMGEAYIKTFVALKETDKVDELREWVKKEYSLIQTVLEGNRSLAIKGVVLSNKEDSEKVVLFYKELLEHIASVMEIDL